MKFLISSHREFAFHPVSQSDQLEDETRALVIDEDGYIQMAVYYKKYGWYDEGSIAHSGGIGGGIPNVIEFAIIE